MSAVHRKALRMYGLIFSAPMVRALLAGTKTQTRRLAWGDTFSLSDAIGSIAADVEVAEAKGYSVEHGRDGRWHFAKPAAVQRIKPGDLVWVRESINISVEAGNCYYDADKVGVGNRAYKHLRENVKPGRWFDRTIPAIHCFEEASRLTLAVTATRIERVQDISEADAIAEGIDRVADNYGNGPAYCDYGLADRDTAEWFRSPVRSYGSLWAHLHGQASWKANPEVVALTFTVHRKNISEISEAA